MSEQKPRDGVMSDPRYFKFHGSTDCKSCETGRVTLFIANDECMTCNPKSYEVTPNTVQVDRETWEMVTRAVKEFKYQAMRTYGSRERAEEFEEPYPWKLIFDAYEALAALKKGG